MILIKPALSISNSIMKLRMVEALRLLKHSGKSVKEIADVPGFENVQTFSRSFNQRNLFVRTVFIAFLLLGGCKSIYTNRTNLLNNKSYPEKWAAPIKAALLYYPELEHINIEFKEKWRIVPLSTRPSLFSLFKPHNKRTYLIIISRKSIPILTPILLKNLSLKAQIGVLGHELAHIADMQRFGFRGFVKHGIRYTFSSKYGDQFEYQTDSLCIVHGLGPELKCWSIEVREKIGHTQIFKEKRESLKKERYMSPMTIEEMMQKLAPVCADSLQSN